MNKKIPLWILLLTVVWIAIDILDAIAFYTDPASEYFLPGIDIQSPVVHGATWMLGGHCLANSSVLLLGLLLRDRLVLASGLVLHAIVDAGYITADVMFGLATAGDAMMVVFIVLKLAMAAVLFRATRAVVALR